MQLVEPNLSVVGTAGECLHYAGMVFGIYSGPNTAWEAWTQTKYPHKDTNFPSNLSFPVWFSWEVDGHVAIHTPNGIYTSPLAGTGHLVYPSISALESAFGVTYVGWSEDIEGKRVIEGGIMNQTNVNNLYIAVLGRKADSSGLKTFTGKPWATVLADLMGSTEYKNRVAKIASNATLAAEVPTLEAEIKSLGSPTVLNPGTYKVN